MHVIYFTFKYSLDEPMKWKEVTKEYCGIIQQSQWKHYEAPI